MEEIEIVRRALVKAFIIVVCIACLFGACSALNKKLGLQDDNAIEEGIENLIERNSGIDIDLTPGSKECPTCGAKS